MLSALISIFLFIYSVVFFKAAKKNIVRCKDNAVLLIFLFKRMCHYIIKHRTPHSALRTPHSALRTPHSALRTPHSALRTPHSALRTPHSALRTPHSSGGFQHGVSILNTIIFSDTFCRITRVRNIAHPRNLGTLFIYYSSTICQFLDSIY